MVVLEAAAIGAAGYGVYRGGEAVGRKGKETLKEHRRERNRQGQRKELAQKAKGRKERLAQLSVMRTNGGAAAPAATTSLASTSTSSTSSSSSVLDRMRADHSKKSSGGLRSLFKKK